MKIRKNIILILKESFKWRNRNLLEKNNDPPQLTFKNILKSNIYYIIFAIIISLFVNNLFKDEKISTFLITLFSILICFIVPALTLIFDKFLESNPKIEVKKDYESDPINIAEKKDIGRQFMTETLARVYLEQEKYTEAIQAYQILMLKNPAKSTYFADQIAIIRKLQNK